MKRIRFVKYALFMEPKYNADEYKIFTIVPKTKTDTSYDFFQIV